MDRSEPPSAIRAKTPLFFIGQNSRGNWVAQDERHLCGGLFINRAAALKFALFENGRRPQAVVMVPGVFELDLSRKPQPAPAANSDAVRPRRAA
jgi:hypothetical protein